MKGMAISNEQKVAAFDGIMRLVGIHALGEWFSGSTPPERPTPILIIAKYACCYMYWTGYYAEGKWNVEDQVLSEKQVVCWKYDDAENIVKLLKF